VVFSALAGVTNMLNECLDIAEKGGTDYINIINNIEKRHLEIAERMMISPRISNLMARIKHMTGQLLNTLEGISYVGEKTLRSSDMVLSFGEMMSIELIKAILSEQISTVTHIDSREFIFTKLTNGAERLEAEMTEKAIKEKFAGASGLIITSGYIASSVKGYPTTLGRGGSDYSASLFGAALHASEIRIWTDAEGILTGDSRIVPQARTVEVLGCEEASELVAYGARILHPATIRPALEAGIPVTVRSMLKPDGKFTTIRPGSSSGKAVVAIAMRRDVAVISVRQELMMEQSGFLARLFAAFGRLGVSVDLVSTSEICVSVSLNMDAPLEKLASELAELGTVDIMRDRAVIAIVGDMLKETPPLLRKTFNALGDVDIDMVSMGANDINLSIVLRAGEADEALRRLHAVFFENSPEMGAHGEGS